MYSFKPEIRIYSPEEIPDALSCQIRSFIRMTWYDSYRYEGPDAPVAPAEWHPTLVTLGEGHVLISYAGVVWRMIEHQEQLYKLYGLTGVFTYPAFRGCGYGRQLITAASAIIDHAPDADMALLWTDPKLERFYRDAGWEHTPTIAVLLGDKSHPAARPDDFMMMKFVSEKGRAVRPTLENSGFYFAEHGW